MLETEGYELELYEHTINLPRLFFKVQKLGLNPYFEYSKHPEIRKVIDEGIEIILKTWPLIPPNYIKSRFKDGLDSSTITLYIELI